MTERTAGQSSGFTLFELLVAIGLTSVVLTAATASLLAHSRAQARQDLSVAMEQNVRVAMTMINDSLRTARYGAPSSGFATWFPWVSGFAAQGSNPRLIYGATAADPDAFQVAACFRRPVASLAAGAPAGTTELTVVPDTNPGETLEDILDNGTKSLILIGDRENAEHAFVIAVAGNVVTIDTDPLDPDNDPVTRTYPEGSPICRVDVLTFSIAMDPDTGVNGLWRDEHHGEGPELAAGGIEDLQIVQETSRRFRITVESRSESRDPVQRDFLRHTLVSRLTLRN